MTPQQYKILKTIDIMTLTNGYSPTHQEVANITGYRSRQGVSGIINRLIKLGYLTKIEALDRRNVFTTTKGRKLLIK